MTEILMSIKPAYVQKIISGEKTIELRSRKLNVLKGAKVWIYSTMPIGCIEIVATIESIEYKCPRIIWELYSSELAITKSEFDKYTNNNAQVSAIKLANVLKVTRPVTLDFIRSCSEKFQPPQFFSHLKPNMELFEILKSGFTPNEVC